MNGGQSGQPCVAGDLQGLSHISPVLGSIYGRLYECTSMSVPKTWNEQQCQLETDGGLFGSLSTSICSVVVRLLLVPGSGSCTAVGASICRRGSL